MRALVPHNVLRLRSWYAIRKNQYEMYVQVAIFSMVAFMRAERLNRY